MYVSNSQIGQNEAKLPQDFKGPFSIGNVGVRSSTWQPRSPAFGQASQGTREGSGNPGFSRIRFRLWTTASPRLRRKSLKVSGLLRKYSRFAETLGGDWFDHDCRRSRQWMWRLFRHRRPYWEQ